MAQRAPWEEVSEEISSAHTQSYYVRMLISDFLCQCAQEPPPLLNPIPPLLSS